MDNKIKRKRKKGPVVMSKKMRTKVQAFFGIVIVILVFLCVKIILQNNEKGDEYAIQVLNQQNYSSTTIPFQRGDIKDRNGNIIATSIKVYNMIIDPKIILSDNEKYYEDTVEALVKCFGFDKEEISNFIKDNSQRSYYVYKKKLSYDDIKEFLEMKEDTKNNPNIQGVWFETEYERKYPYSSLACSIIGFTSAGNVGTWGIEEYYNEYLNGVDGRKFGYVNNDNIMQEVEKSAVNGNTIISTIDINIQTIIEKHINEYNELYDPEHIGIVIMDPSNGEILAMAGKKSYDLNNPRDLSKYYTEEEIAAMTEEEQYAALNDIWRNYCISDSYEPGSTAKPYTIAAALDEGLIQPEDEFVCDGREIVGGWTIKCHKNEGHGTISLYQTIAYSCNDALMFIAAKEGANTFTSYLQRFNFGLKTRIDLPGEESCANLVRKAEEMGPADLATNSFGQNYNVTMVQVASAFSSLVNGGYYYQPHVVKEIINENGGVVKTNSKTLVKQTVTTATSDIIKQGLRLCVSGGTGGSAGVEGYLIAGKTGTAERQPRGTNTYLLSFIGFAPYDNPKVVCYVVVDNPDVEGEQYTSYATKLWKAVMEEVLPAMNIFPDDIPEEEPTQPDEPQAPDTPQTPDGSNTQTPSEPQTPPAGDSEEVFGGGIIDEGTGDDVTGNQGAGDQGTSNQGTGDQGTSGQGAGNQGSGGNELANQN